jgi:hypothetical protein
MVPSWAAQNAGLNRHGQGRDLFRCIDAPWFERVVKFGGMKCTIGRHGVTAQAHGNRVRNECGVSSIFLSSHLLRSPVPSYFCEFGGALAAYAICKGFHFLGRRRGWIASRIRAQYIWHVRAKIWERWDRG